MFVSIQLSEIHRTLRLTTYNFGQKKTMSKNVSTEVSLKFEVNINFIFS